MANLLANVNVNEAIYCV